MAADDIESQIKQCRAQLSTAQNLYWQSKFQEAEELYKQCLSKLDHIFPGENLDTAACLLGLGDTYYFQSRYLLALNQYTRLLAIREKLGAHDVPSVITANLKVAKTHEKLQEFDEAAKHFKRSLDLAQTNLSIGDPLLLNLLEAYCNFLRQAQPESGLIHDLERKAELCRKKAAEMAGEPPPPARNERPTGEYVALGQPKREQKDRAKAAQAAQSLYPTALEYDTAEKSSAHLKSIGQSGMIISALVACSLLIFVTMVGGAIYCAVTGGREGAVVKAEQDFATIDGDRKIHFLAGGKAELTRGTTTAQIRYQTLSNPVEGILFLIGGQNSNAPYCLKTDAGIIYPESADFYTNDSAEFKVVEHMKLVAATLEKFYEENKRYPENFEEFIQLDPKLEYKNAFTGLRQMPSYVTGMWGDSGDPEALNALLAKTGHLDTKKMDPTVCYVTVAKSLPAGGVMSLCVGPKGGKPAAFYVLGAD
ncbi:MAG TPA: tetratricopeptide repeat protein, partial [Candidatus Obscuribacterales bacterium]